MQSSPSYIFYQHPSTLYSPPNFPTDFQSNYASIRSSGPGAALVGLGIECPQLSISHGFMEPLIDTTVRRNLYTPFSSTGLFYAPPETLPKRNYMSAAPGIKSTPMTDLGWGASALSPFHSPVLVSCPPMLSTTEQDLPVIKSTESPETSASLSFRVLSAASGLSPGVLATQISATAEIALQLMSNSQPNTPYFGAQSGSRDDNELSTCQAWSANCIHTPEMVAPVADINMRHLMLSHQDTITGVNPADTLPNYALSLVCPTHLDSQLEYFRSPETPFADIEDNDGNEDLRGSVTSDEILTKHTIDQSKDTDTLAAWLSLEARTLEGSPHSQLVGDSNKKLTACEEPEPSEYEPSVVDCLSDPDFSPASPGYKFRQKIPQRKVTLPHISMLEPYAWPNKPLEVSNIDLGTPVINAHLGIALPHLQEKAERYRLRNNMLLASTGEIEQQYDRRWLLSFVGRLSQRGEVIKVYRCYVTGCTQTNKRRDHILIHLGGHLGQRPFKCTVCPARFLRKNECKRHELSHSGERPFICDFCQCGFVRQDLLKRHIRRTHSIKEAPTKRKLGGDGSPRRPKKRSKAS